MKQDLWVCYLSGTPTDALSLKLEVIKLEHQDHTFLQVAIWSLLKQPISEPLSNIIQLNFTDYEKSIICLLTLGLDSAEISNIKGISEVRIRQTIATIRYNKVWRETYGLKEESDR